MYLRLEKYHRPETVEAALRLLEDGGGKAALLGGGTDLNVHGHEHLVEVIDLQALGLGGISREGDVLRLGASLTLGQLRRAAELEGEHFTALRQAAAAFAVKGIQNRATLGGRIMVDRADQDLPPALAALGARLVLRRLSGGAVVEETLDYPLGDARAALEGALLVAVLLPVAPGASALRRFGRSAVDRPLMSVAAAVSGETVRIAANLQGPGAADLKRFELTEQLAAAWLAARPADWRDQARGSLLIEAAAFEDPWASGEYRKDLCATLALRALAAVLGEEEVA
ncbi:MAG: FAD binding domain-containing protein [Deltaproteobacteria bacterium]|nr:FAD binding domain-containing protein [Deltaproteobacteria bacterium]